MLNNKYVRYGLIALAIYAAWYWYSKQKSTAGAGGGVVSLLGPSGGTKRMTTSEREAAREKAAEGGFVRVSRV